jgi:hypothetical protein
MSLFENDQYQWRETYFVLFDRARRPDAQALAAALEQAGKELEISNVRHDPDGRIESLTVCSPDDYAAMDISYVTGEEVTEQVADLIDELQTTQNSPVEKALLSRLMQCTGRLDVYHFEQTVSNEVETDDATELMDPGALLTILEQLARLCDGVVIDPQTGILL